MITEKKESHTHTLHQAVAPEQQKGYTQNTRNMQ